MHCHLTSLGFIPKLSNNFINLNFDIVVEPSSIEKEPPFELHDGVNYVNGDDSKIYLQLNAPNKDFIYVLGNFNQYIKSNESLMNVNPLNNKFWIEINDLNENENYWYQYEVFSKSPVSIIAVSNSVALSGSSITYWGCNICSNLGIVLAFNI